MKIQGRRQSQNFEDRRGITGRNMARAEAQLEMAFNPSKKKDRQSFINTMNNKEASMRTVQAKKVRTSKAPPKQTTKISGGKTGRVSKKDK